VIQSNTSGSSSSVVVSNLDNDAASLGLNSVTTTTGIDAAGSLGGFAATVSGTQLTGGLGTPTEGVKLNVLGGATSDLGSLYFSRGIGSKVDTLLSSLLSANGLVEARLTGLASSVKDVTASRQALSERADNLEALYRNQFNNLETLISGINETGSFLNQALSGFVAPLSFVKK
jgi:flagellar hook-associated protein 2